MMILECYLSGSGFFFPTWCLTLLGAYVVMPGDGKALVPKER